MCVYIYRTGELISADKALQAFLVPAVPAAAIIHLMEYNAFITARISQRTSQFINQRCVYTAPIIPKIAAAVDKRNKRNHVTKSICSICYHAAYKAANEVSGTSK